VNQDSTRVVVIAVAIAALGGGGFWWWRTHQPKPAPARPAAAARPLAPSTQPVQPIPPPPPPAALAVRHPLPKADGSGLPGLDQADGFLRSRLQDLLGRKAVQSFLVSEGLVRRVVATVDNLGRDHAPSTMWPVVPTPGRFLVQPGKVGATTVIGAPNHDRYTPFVAVATSVDAQRLVGLYRRIYPLLQQAYEDLGYPGKYFNDRVVDVIDDLLRTPEPAAPVAVKAVEIPGSEGAVKVGGLYLFEDAALEARPLGQKILLRMGRANAARVKAKLVEIRRLIATDFSAGVPGK
jgi:hypothetical protein